MIDGLVYANVAGVAIRNDGSINGGIQNAAIALNAGGTVVNGAVAGLTAVIAGSIQGVFATGAPVLVSNDGTITGGLYGVLLGPAAA